MCDVTDSGLELPLHKFGTVNTANTNTTNNDEQFNSSNCACALDLGPSLLLADSAQHDRRDALIELQLVKRLQKNVRGSSNLFKHIEENVIPLALGPAPESTAGS